MNIYLAARYSRRQELCQYRNALEALGHLVTSRWLNGSHQISSAGVPIDETGEALIEAGSSPDADKLRREFVEEDLSDVSNAEVMISFTEIPRSNHSRGGRHVEFGLAVAMKKVVFVVGYRENLFHYLPEVIFCDTWKTCLESLHLAPLNMGE